MTLTLLMILITKIIYLLSIEADTRSDRYTKNTGRIHHAWQMIVLVVIFTPILLWHTSFEQATLTVLSYAFLRAGLFNLRLNRLRGLKPWYLGDGWFDRLHKPLAKIEQNGKFPALFFVYCIYIAIGLFLGLTNIL